MRIKDLLYWLLYTENYPISQNVAGGIGIARAGKIVSITIQNVNNLPAGTTVLATLPARFCPYHQTFESVVDPNRTTKIRVQINSSGQLSLINYGSAITANSNASGTMTYATKRGIL